MTTTELSFSLDSIFKARPEALPLLRPSPFIGHQLQLQHTHYHLLPTAQSQPWVFALLILIALFLCLFLRNTHTSLSDLFKSTFSNRHLQHIIREHRFNRFANALAYTLLLATSLALLTFFLASDLMDNAIVSHPMFFPMLLICITLILLLRYLFIAALGNIFYEKDAVSTCITSSYTVNFLQTLFLVPILLILFYAPFPALSHFGPTLLLASPIILLFVIRIVRNIQIILTTSNNSKFYLFYYLCIIELLPIIILTKEIISMQIK